MTVVAGLDGCRTGWVAVLWDIDGGTTTVEHLPHLTDLVRGLDTGEVTVAGIDIPIGLPSAGRRPCDVEARARLGPRRSSVFPAPPRAVLGSDTYATAVAASRAVSATAISRQTFGLLPKIAEVDRLLLRHRRDRLVEVHPELSFAVLTGAPAAHNKKTPAGRDERLAALRPVFPALHRSDPPPHGARPDDVLDAYAVAWTARRWLSGTHLRLGGQRDDGGRPMQIIV